MYEAFGFGFELQPSHYFAWVRGLVGSLQLGSFRDVPLRDLMHLRTRLNHPVKLEKQAASTLADRNEAAQCGRNLATFLSRAFNEELGDAFRRLSEYCAWLVLNDTSFTWEDHVRVLEDALQRIDDNVVSSEVAVAQWA